MPAARVLAAAVVLAAAAATPLAPDVAGAAPHGAGMVRLAGELPGWTRAATDLGPLPATRALQVGVTIARPDPAGERRLVNELYNPASPLFHDFPSVAQFDAEFGVPAGRFAQVERFATSHGLQVDYASDSNDFLLLAGTAAQVERTFRVSLRAFDYRGRQLYANIDAPAVPAGLGISAVSSLASDPGLHYADAAPGQSAALGGLQAVHPDGVTPTGGDGTASGYPAQDGCNAVVPGDCVGVIQPEALYSVYKLPALSVNGGQGERMGIIGEGEVDTVIRDLRFYEVEHKLPKMEIRIKSVADTFTDTSGDDEWELDTQSSTSMSPYAEDETLYFADSLNDAPLIAAVHAFADDPGGPTQASMSIGGCELVQNVLDASFITGIESSLTKAVALGKTLFTSAGDSGGSCAYPVAENGLLNNIVPSPEYPASSPNAVGVGGTVLYTKAKGATTALPATRALEYAWTYTGGGASSYFGIPSFQTKIAVIDQDPCLALSPSTPGPLRCRGVPDIAALSGDVTDLVVGQSDGNSYSIVGDGSFDGNGGGTSLSSPLEMGIWTRIQAASPKVKGAYRGLGFADDAYYGLALHSQATDDADFFNVGGTTDSIPVTGNGQEVTMPRSAIDPTGWSYVSGLGVPEVTPIMLDLDHRLTPSHPAPMDKVVDHLAVCANPGGVVNDPHGMANGEPVGSGTLPVDYPGTQMTKGWVTYDRAAGTLSFHAYMPNLAEAVNPILIRTLFGYDNVGYYADAERGPAGDFYSLRTGDAVRPVTLSVPGLSGSFDDATHTVTFTINLADFNKAVHAAPPLGPGRTIQPLEWRSRTDVGYGTNTGVSTVNELMPLPNACGYTLPLKPASGVSPVVVGRTGSTGTTGSAGSTGASGATSAGGTSLARTGAPLGELGLLAMGLISLAVGVRRRMGRPIRR